MYVMPYEIFKMGHSYCYGKRDNVSWCLKCVEIANMLSDVRYVVGVPHYSYEFCKVFMKGLL
jgi:hypothetical protein